MGDNKYGEKFKDLRSKAEKVLAEKGPSKKRALEMDELIHELEVHQIELEMQNENLIESQITLEKSQREYYLLYDFAPLSYLTINEKGLITRLNLKCSEILGTTRNRLINSAFTRFIAPPYKKIFNEHCQEVKKTLLKNECEIELLRPDQSPLFVSLDTIAVLDEKGEFKEFGMIITDINDRKKAEKEIGEFNNRLKATIEAIPDLMFEVDEEGRFYDYNAPISEKLYVSPEEFLGKTVSDVLPPEAAAKIMAALKEASEKGNHHGMTYELPLPSGKKIFELSIAKKISNKSKPHFIALAHDISERQSRDKQIKIHNKTLEGINEIFQKVITSETEDEIAKKSLEVCEEITSSEFGFILELNQKGKLDTLSISDPGWNECLMGKDDAVVMIKDMEEHGIYGKATKDNVAVLTNDPSNHEDSVGTPPGHPKIKSFLGVPLRQGGAVIGSIGLANKEDGYNIEDQEILEKLSIAISESIMRKRAETSLNIALEDKELLLKEIHHRVKNNLIVISSLLSLQSRYITDPDALDIFKESQNRAKSMALIHERLYQSSDLKKIDFGDYIRTLATDLFRTYIIDPNLIKLTINVENIKIDINTAIPLGLIVNELVSNSMKYAFPNDSKGEIIVDFNSDNKFLNLIVKDNGIGLPKDFDYKNTNSLGLELVKSLTNQIDGKIEVIKSPGTIFKIKFQEIKYN